ncbi:hypothetical protein BF49_3621 [Bradyrhizobium sp.]|uniref:hypothetical protein n=1 Tax=Bradyrhizobium sp. TaxID=376 RepID=UPI0007C1921C|nr:hypothetical protein [Bradyrhizobium sp.]CUT12541.1 hypothetical protein BF49_3621 [Bradyrhizobium sp.]
MGETITIPVTKPLISPEGEVKQVVLREPTFDEFLSYGDPYTVARSIGGVPFAAENPEVIAQYMKLCLVEPKDPQILRQGKARLAKEMKEALLSFFHPDAPAKEDSKEG